MSYLKPLLFLCILFFVDVLSAQSCGTDAFLDKCAPALSGYTFIKTFDVKTTANVSKSQVSYVFSKGSTYRLVICDEGVSGNRMKVKLSDRNKKLIATNYVASSKKYYPSLDYKCTATGVYYVDASFKKGKSGCGVVILGFTK